MIKITSSKSILKSLCIITIILAPLDIYRVSAPVANISLFRVTCIILITSFSLYASMNALYIRKSILAVWALYLTGAFISFSISANKMVALPELLNILLGMGLVIVLSIVVETRKDLYLMMSAFASSFLFYIIFFIITYYVFFTAGEIITSLPLSGVLPFKLADVGHLAEGHLTRTPGGIVMPRLTLPHTSPPHTANILVIGIVISTGLLLQQERTVWKIALSAHICLLCLALIATVSRSGLLAIAFAAVVFFSLIYAYFGISKRQITVLAAAAGGVLVGSILVFPTEAIVRRFTSISSPMHHLRTRVTAISIAMSRWDLALFGGGLNNYIVYAEGPNAHHSHSPYTTILVERGILGSILYWLVFYWPAVLLTRIIYNKKPEDRPLINLTLLVALLSVLFGSLLYEYIFNFPVWILLGLMFASLNSGSVKL